MTLLHISATFECDGCGSQFAVHIDRAGKIEGYADLDDVATDTVRGGPGCSVQHGHPLCTGCTRIVDAIGAEDYMPPWDEMRETIDETLARQERKARKVGLR